MPTSEHTKNEIVQRTVAKTTSIRWATAVQILVYIVALIVFYFTQAARTQEQIDDLGTEMRELINGVKLDAVEVHTDHGNRISSLESSCGSHLTREMGRGTP